MDPYLDSTEHLEEFISDLRSKGVTNENIRVARELDQRALILAGLIPRSVPMSSPWIADWLAGASEEDILFWHGIPLNILLSIMMDEPWTYKTIEQYKRDAISTASSLPLMLYAPDMMYKQSKRPVTDMSLFRTPTSRTASRNELSTGQINIDGEIWNVVPVTRYAAGMSSGLYYGDRPTTACGIFYYLEPESTTYLAHKTEMRAFNKTAATSALGHAATNENEHITRHMNGTYPRNLMLTAAQVQKMEPSSSVSIENVSESTHYAGERLGMYAEEDSLDQDLCVLADRAGYDVVILESMVGRYQVVTEVLDTRNRSDSFSSLIYLVEK